MIKLPFLTKQPEQNKYIGLDMQSGIIRAVVFYIDEAKKISVIGAAERIPEPYNLRDDNIIDTEAAAEDIKACVKEALTELDTGITKAIVGIGGTNSINVMTSARIKKAVREKPTLKEIAETEKKLKSESYMLAQNEFLYTKGDSDTELEELTSSYINIRADGMPTADVENAEGHIIDIGMTSSFAPAYYLKNLQRTFKQAGLQISAAVPKLYTLTELIKRKNHEDFIIINADACQTNIGVVFSGGILADKTINIGKDHVVESISEKMGVTLREAEKLLEGYKEGKLAPTESHIVLGYIRDVLYLWTTAIKLSMSEFTGVKTFPSTVFIAGEMAEIEEAMTIFRETDWLKNFAFKESPVVEKADLYMFDEIIDLTGRTKSAKWLPSVSLGMICKEISG